MKRQKLYYETFVKTEGQKLNRWLPGKLNQGIIIALDE